MDIDNIWKQDDNSDSELNKLLNTNDFNRLESKLPLKKLKQNLLIGILWAILITIGYLVIFFFFQIWQVYVALGLLIVVNIIIIIDSWNLYKRTPNTISSSNSLKQELTIHYNSFQQWWAVQQKVSLFVYPIAVAGGFILGGTMGSDKPAEAFLYNSKNLFILAISILILVPICYFGARWMFNYAYGKHLTKLKATIDELS